jgi:hypothetical protein
MLLKLLYLFRELATFYLLNNVIASVLRDGGTGISELARGYIGFEDLISGVVLTDDRVIAIGATAHSLVS